MKQQPSSSRRRMPSTMARAALLLAVLFTGAVHADWAVNDKDANDKLQEIQDGIGGKSSDGNLNATTSKIYQEIKTSVQKLDFTPTLTPNNQLKKITDTSAYVQQACPTQSSSGGAGQNITTITTISVGDASSTRQQICQQIIQLRVQAFNDTIDMSDRFQKYSEQITSIDSNRQSAKTQGDLWANTNESLRTMNKLQAEMGFWRTRLAAYDAAIKFHEGQQNTLSQTAIKGSGGSGGGLPSTGQLIQTGALAAALAVK